MFLVSWSRPKYYSCYIKNFRDTQNTIINTVLEKSSINLPTPPLQPKSATNAFTLPSATSESFPSLFTGFSLTRLLSGSAYIGTLNHPLKQRLLHLLSKHRQKTLYQTCNQLFLRFRAIFTLHSLNRKSKHGTNPNKTEN